VLSLSLSPSLSLTHTHSLSTTLALSLSLSVTPLDDITEDLDDITEHIFAEIAVSLSFKTQESKAINTKL